MVARRAHNPEVAGSSPASATRKSTCKSVVLLRTITYKHGHCEGENSPRLVYERLLSVFFFVFLEEGRQTRWLASLQISPKFVAFIELFNHFPRENQECQAIVIWHSSLSVHSIISVFSVTIRAEIKGGQNGETKILLCAYDRGMAAYD